jgi:hypothetical protein
METQVSVMTTSAPAMASAGSSVTCTDPPVPAAIFPASATMTGRGWWPAGAPMRMFMPAVAPPSR